MRVRHSKLEAWRLEKGLTYAELGDLLGVTRQYAHRICNHGLPAAERVSKITDVTNGYVQVTDLFDYEDLSI